MESAARFFASKDQPTCEELEITVNDETDCRYRLEVKDREAECAACENMSPPRCRYIPAGVEQFHWWNRLLAWKDRGVVFRIGDLPLHDLDGMLIMERARETARKEKEEKKKAEMKRRNFLKGKSRGRRN